MAEFASKGVAGPGLGLGIAGTALGVLAGGLNNMGVGGLFGAANSEDKLVNRYELAQAQEIESLKSQIALRDANTYSDQKLLELYKYVDGELKDIRHAQCTQAVINAKHESVVDVLGSQVASINTVLGNITRTVIPNANVCPGWGNVCVTSTGCSSTNGYNSNI